MILPRALVVYARVPRRGGVKTRLVPWLGADGALALHRALLEDSVSWLRRAAGAAGARPVLSFSEAWEPRACGADAGLARGAAGVDRLPQGRGDLGARLRRTFQHLLGAGHVGVVIVGSDSPTLPIERPAEAFACLEEGADAAVVPAEDGGYCLLGARRALPDLFAGISWGTAEVLRATIAAARRSGLRLSLLDPWHDVDTPEDLLRLAREIAVSPAARRPRRTAALIGALRRRGRL